MPDENATGRGRVTRWVDRHFYEPIRRQDAAGRHAPRLPKFVPSLVLLFVLSAVGGLALFIWFARLNRNPIEWWPPGGGSLNDGQLFEVVRSTVTAATVLGAGFAAVYAYRKQRVDEAAGKRADDEGLAKRYQDAAGQLGHEKAAVRLAGVHAMARLAQDWPEQRQTCVNVLCAYLSMPWPAAFWLETSELNPEDEMKVEEEQRVRIAIVDTFAFRYAANVVDDKHGTHLTGSDWHRVALDLSGAVLPRLDFSQSRFSAPLNFQDAIFTGATTFEDSKIEPKANFQNSQFLQPVTFKSAAFQRQCNFEKAKFVQYAQFYGCGFGDDAGFSYATFEGRASFNQAHFLKEAQFGLAIFERNATFESTKIGNGRFHTTTFGEGLDLSEATIGAESTFEEARIAGWLVRPDGSREEATDEPRPLELLATSTNPDTENPRP